MSKRSQPRRNEPTPIVVLVEWQAPQLSLAEARRVTAHSASVLRRVPGLLDARFFGDFEGGTHCFLLTWRDRAAMDAYMASEEMQSVRSAAAAFVTQPPSRRVFVDYTSAGSAAEEASTQTR